MKLLLIPYLVPTKTQIKKTQKKSWKPSLSESAAAFAVHVTVCSLYYEYNSYRINIVNSSLFNRTLQSLKLNLAEEGLNTYSMEQQYNPL